MSDPMQIIDIQNRFDNLDRVIRENQLIRRGWSTEYGGRCLVAAISEECAQAKSAADIPRYVIPAWWAALATDIDDRGSLDHWIPNAKRWSKVTRKASLNLTPQKWDEVREEIHLLMLTALNLAAPHTLHLGTRYVREWLDEGQTFYRALHDVAGNLAYRVCDMRARNVSSQDAETEFWDALATRMMDILEAKTTGESK